MNKKLFYFSLVVLLASAFSLHKYYHSHCDLEINPKTGNAEAVIEVFWHDLEVSVGKENKKKVKMADKDFKELVQIYLKKHFTLRDSAGVEKEFNYIGNEMKGDETVLYLEFKETKSFAGCQLTNTLMLNEFPSQVNQVNVKEGTKKNSLVFDKKIVTQSL
jgi:hypothetical protein